jgi:hypothetical protein
MNNQLLSLLLLALCAGGAFRLGQYHPVSRPSVAQVLYHDIDTYSRDCSDYVQNPGGVEEINKQALLDNCIRMNDMVGHNPVARRACRAMYLEHRLLTPAELKP